jgi:hypothetical protein
MIKSMEFAGIFMVPILLDYTFGKHGEEMLPYLGALEHVNCLGGMISPLLPSSYTFKTDNCEKDI